MLKIFHDGDSGLFGVCMGSQIHNPRDPDIEAAMRDAEHAFERAMEQAARTEFDDELSARLAFSSIIESWRCVVRARAAAGC
jgi:hypothetical protein